MQVSFHSQSDFVLPDRNHFHRKESQRLRFDFQMSYEVTSLQGSVDGCDPHNVLPMFFLNQSADGTE